MKTDGTRIIAHRGYSACYPDNTWKAILAAQTADAKCCEIDLMLSADNELIISHDDFIGKHLIAEMVLLSYHYQCEVFHPRWESRAPFPHSLLSRKVITRIHETGLKGILWHEEREDELEHLLNLGVDVICTNDPECLKRIRDVVGL